MTAALITVTAIGIGLVLIAIVHDLLWPPPDPMDAEIEQALALTRPEFAHELRAHEYGEVRR